MPSSSAFPDDARLRVEASAHHDPLRVTLHGEADHANLDQLTAALAGIELNGQKGVQVDVSDLEFIDSAGLRRLSGFVTRLRQSGLNVTVLGVRPVLRRAAHVLQVEDELGLT